MGLPLPEYIEVRHKFLTVSPKLTIRNADQVDLYRIECPSLRLNKHAFIFRAASGGELALRISPVAGLTRDLKVSLSDNEIVGVIQKEMSEKTRRSVWTAISSGGDRQFFVMPEGSAAHRLKTRLALFSSLVDNIYYKDKCVGSFITQAGFLHEKYIVNIDEPVLDASDQCLLLGLIVALTGIMNRVFT